MCEIKCPGLDCVELLDPLVCQSFLPVTVLVRWFDALCELTVSKFQRVHCPFQECSALILNECGEKVTKSNCPDCKKLLCFECKLPWHAGYRCDETGQLRDRNDILLGELMETRQWKKCPVCNQGVELRSGCRIVRCRCGSKFCYKCGRSWCSCRSAHLIIGMVICLLVGLSFWFFQSLFKNKVQVL